jgi:hypothetical protein
MRKILRKTLIIVVLFAPLFVNTDCKKQKKCGCRGDILFQYGRESQIYVDDRSSVIVMQQEGYVGYYYDYYTFCNPDEIMPQLANFKSGDVLMVVGNVYWNCNYVMQESSNPYSSYANSYDIYVTDIYMNMYGEDNSDETLKRAQ